MNTDAVPWIILAAVILAGLFTLRPLLAQERWPGPRWQEKLDKPLEEWQPVKDLLSWLAARAGAEVSFEGDITATFMVPVPAGITLQQAFGRVASISALQAAWEGDRLVVKTGGRIGSWLQLVGGEARPVRAGEARGGIIVPAGATPAGPRPWVWYAPNGLDPSHGWIVKHLLAAGVAVAVVNVGETQGNPEGRAVFTAFYERLRAAHGVAARAVLWPQSRGGLMLYNWAAEHPDRVAAIGGIYTVCDLRSYPGMEKAAAAYGMSVPELEAHLTEHNPVDRIASLAKTRVPILHIHGDRDNAVPVEKNAGELVRRYLALGGEAELVIIPGKTHEVVPEFFQNRKLVEFLISHARAAAKESG